MHHALSRGLKETTGKYIKILDADDYYDTANLKLFIRRLNETDADAILSCHSVYVNDIKKETIRFHKYNDGQIVSVENNCLAILQWIILLIRDKYLMI